MFVPAVAPDIHGEVGVVLPVVEHLLAGKGQSLRHRGNVHVACKSNQCLTKLDVSGRVSNSYRILMMAAFEILRVHKITTQ
jgi:hypothetical protein